MNKLYELRHLKNAAVQKIKYLWYHNDFYKHTSLIHSATHSDRMLLWATKWLNWHKYELIYLWPPKLILCWCKSLSQSKHNALSHTTLKVKLRMWHWCCWLNSHRGPLLLYIFIIYNICMALYVGLWKKATPSNFWHFFFPILPYIENNLNYLLVSHKPLIKTIMTHSENRFSLLEWMKIDWK